MNAMTGLRGVAARSGGDEPKFKVGDRVALHDFPYILDENQRAGTVTGRVQTGRGDWTVEIENYGDTLQFFEDEMTPLVPALRIEAGKYYLTRDGRRVGPISRNGSEGGHFYWKASEDSINGYKAFWCEDGRFYDWGKEFYLDLIAEAPTPTKGNPAAQVDNLADEYGGGKRESKFKVGDRVDCRGLFSLDPSIGTVVGFAENGNPYVVVDGRVSPWGQLGWCYLPKQLRLVAPATSGTTPAIVALIENGRPKPATRPYIHRSREAATAEAARLAGKHKGQEFGVFELVDTRKEAAPKKYDHEWQRLAAEGKKLGAIQALRAQAGLTLYGAKTAVESFTAAA